MIRCFVCKVLYCLSLLCVFITVVWGVVVFNRSTLCKTKANILFLGNSRIQFGIDDRLIPNSLNAGLNADNYVFSYLKLKLLKKYNPQIDTLFLGIDNVSVFHYFQVSGDKFHPFFWDLLTVEDWFFFLKNDRAIFQSPLEWLKILYPLKSYMGSVSFQQLGIGGFSELHRDKLKIDIDRYYKQKRNTSISKEENISLFQDLYLRKIISFCNQKNIKLFLLNMPSYPINNNESDDLGKYIHSNFSEIPYYDFRSTHLPDSCYGDISHLNYKGARAFTEIFYNVVWFEK